jgi:tetratricopeptide (TPR) repeat protein
MRIVRWAVAAAGSFAALAAAWYAAAHLVGLGDGPSWAIAGTASAVVLAVLSWCAARDPAPGPPAPAATASGQALAAAGDRNILISGSPGATVEVTASSPEPGSLAPAVPAGPAVTGEVPQQPRAFQPRDQVLAPLRRPGAGPEIGVIYAVTGMRGTGKTQLVAALARQAITDRWRLVAWIHADTPATTLNGLAQAAAALGLPVRDDQEATALAVRHHLETSGEGCLLVFDNAPEPGALRRYLPAAGQARILITSTRRAAAGLGTPIPVDVFTDEEALAYLHQRTGLTDVGGAEELAAELGRLPLALAQAAAVITAQHLDYPTYLHRLTTLPLGDYLTPTGDDPYPHGSAAAILLALHTAYDTDPAGLARPVMGLIALLSPAGVPRAVIHTAVLSRRSRPLLRRKARGRGAGPAGADAVLAHLAGTSLLTFSLDGTAISAHRLVTRAIRDQLAHDGTLSVAARAATRALQAMTGDAEPVWQHPRAVKDLIEQITALHAHLQTRPPSPPADVSRELLGLRGWALYSLNELADNPAQAIHLGRQLTTDTARVLGPDHPDTLASRGNLASAYESSGRLAQAISLFEQTLADCERVLGPDHPDTLGSRGNLAGVYESSGRLAEAIPLFEQTLADCERVLGPDHPRTLTSCGNLAVAYESAGRLAQAVPLFEQNLADSERVLGPDHPDTLGSRHNLASAYESSGWLAEAIRLHQQALADFERVLGPDHPATLTSRENLGVAYESAGQLAEAIPLYEQTLADRERVLGPDHPDTLRSRNNLASAYQSSGRLAEAIPLFQQNLADSERVLGPDHPHTLTSCSNLAGAYKSAGRLAEAIPLYEQTLADRERVLGPDHPDTVASRQTVAGLGHEG